MSTTYDIDKPDTTYNGWRNYETWAVKLWMDNDESSYRRWNDEARTAYERVEARDTFTREESAALVLMSILKSEHEADMPDVEGVYGDLLLAAMSEIDWYAIAQHMIADIDGR